MSKTTLIIGAGLSGLVAANVLRKAGAAFTLIESSDAVGGRVRSDIIDGFTLDRGFQVLLDSYPSVKQFLDLPALAPRYFDSGALLADKGDFFRLLHPLRHPDWFASTALTPAFSWADKFALLSLVLGCIAHPDASILGRVNASDETTKALLKRTGISEAMIERFIRPFFGGVFLDDSLETNAALFRYYLKKFAFGRVLIPSGGMGAISSQLAARLPSESLRLNVRIDHLEIAGSRVVAAVAASGERIEAGEFVLATDEISSCQLLGHPAAARPALGVTTIYLKSRQSMYTGGLLVLPSTNPSRLTTHLVQISNIAPELAPPPWHLISVTVLHPGVLTDAELSVRVIEEVGDIFTEVRGHLEPLHVVRTPYGQFVQHPDVPSLIRGLTIPENLRLAGDQVGTASIESAMSAGANAATTVLAGR